MSGSLWEEKILKEEDPSFRCSIVYSMYHVPLVFRYIAPPVKYVCMCTKLDKDIFVEKMYYIVLFWFFRGISNGE